MQNQKIRPIKMLERRNQKRTMIITEVMSRWDLLPDSLVSLPFITEITSLCLKIRIFATSTRQILLRPEFQEEGYASFAGLISYSFRAFAEVKNRFDLCA